MQLKCSNFVEGNNHRAKTIVQRLWFSKVCCGFIVKRFLLELVWYYFCDFWNIYHLQNVVYIIYVFVHIILMKYEVYMQSFIMHYAADILLVEDHIPIDIHYSVFSFNSFSHSSVVYASFSHSIFKRNSLKITFNVSGSNSHSVPRKSTYDTEQIISLSFTDALIFTAAICDFHSRRCTT